MQFSDEVKLWEQVKVRVLNAGHLTLTYPALLLGYREVAEAMRDPQIPVLLERFLDKVVVPLLEAPRDVDLVDYKTRCSTASPMKPCTISSPVSPPIVRRR